MEVVETVGASLVFLSRYSHDLNPFEAAWSKVKARICKRIPVTRRALWCAIRSALRRVTEDDSLSCCEY